MAEIHSNPTTPIILSPIISSSTISSSKRHRRGVSFESIFPKASWSSHRQPLQAMDQLIDESRRVTPHERADYFLRFPSWPGCNLVARSSTDIWLPPRRVGNWGPFGKQLLPMRSHKVNGLWNESHGSLRLGFYQALTGIDWRAIDVLDIQDLDADGEPVRPTVLITVPPGSTDWDTGFPAVLRCQAVLDAHECSDITCAIKEGFVNRLADPQDLEALGRPALLAATTDCVGLAVAPMAEEWNKGTRSLNLRLSLPGEPDLLTTLTCRHVAFSAANDNGEEYKPSDQSEKRWMISPPFANVKEELVDAADETIKMSKVILERLALQFGDTELDSKAIRNKDRAEQRISSAYTLRTSGNSLEDPESRKLGYVVYSPAFNAITTTARSPWVPDWALIAVTRSGSSVSNVSNIVYTGNLERAHEMFIKVIKKHFDPEEASALRQILTFTGEMYADGFKLQGFIPESEIFAPKYQSTLKEPLNGRMSLVVGKHGSVSGLRVGLSNEVKSVTRRPVGHLTEQLAEEWCIVGRDTVRQGASGAFSGPGDSGSAVWGIDQRLGGIMCAGNGAETDACPGGSRNGRVITGDIKGYDVTYVTPWERLRDHIGSCGYNVDLL